MVIFDLEADNLLDKATKIHCICWHNIATNKRGSTSNIKYGIDYLFSEGNKLVGHNIIGYDLPLIEKLTGRKFKGEVLDTLVMSRLMYPDIGSHGLDAWGKRLGIAKPEIEDWSNLSEDILHRCNEDVKINVKLFEKFKVELLDHHGWMKAITLEQEVGYIHNKQVSNGVWFEKEKAIQLLKTIRDKRAEIDKQLFEILPDKYVPVYKTPVNKPYLKNGDYSKAVKDWFKGKDIPKIKGAFTRVGIKKPDLNSTQELKGYLLSNGWKPTEYNIKKEPDGSWTKTSPKLTEDSFGTIKGNTGRLIADRQVLSHRGRLIENEKDSTKGMIANCRTDNRIPAEAITCGTPTGRYRHQKSVCNLPRPTTPYGKDIRQLFSSPSGSSLVGVDLSGIEARVMCHFSLPFEGGKELTELVLRGDFHQHNANLWDVDRNTAKSGLYCLMYGGGAKKLATTLGKPEGRGNKLRKNFWDGNPSLSLLKEEVEKVYKNRGYLIGIDGRKIYIRSQHKLLNSLFQCGATVIFKHWMVLCNRWIKDNDIPARQVIAYHDELQFEVKDGMWLAMVKKQVEHLATVAGKELKIRVEIEAEGKIGKTWSDTH